MEWLIHNRYEVLSQKVLKLIADAALQQAAGQQAIAGIGGLERIRIVGPVERANRLRLAAQVGDLGGRELHTRSQLVGRNPRPELRVAGVAVGMTLVQEGEQRAGVGLLRGRHSLGNVEVPDRLLGAEHDGLVLGREKAVTPVRLAVGGLAADVG